MSNLSAKDYLNQKVKVLFQPIISSMLAEKPKQPVKINLLRFHT